MSDNQSMIDVANNSDSKKSWKMIHFTPTLTISCYLPFFILLHLWHASELICDFCDDINFLRNFYFQRFWLFCIRIPFKFWSCASLRIIYFYIPVGVKIKFKHSFFPLIICEINITCCIRYRRINSLSPRGNNKTSKWGYIYIADRHIKQKETS